MIISDLLCDLYDIQRQAKLHNFGSLPKDSEGTETTINDCLAHLINELEMYEIFEWDTAIELLEVMRER